MIGYPDTKIPEYQDNGYQDTMRSGYQKSRQNVTMRLGYQVTVRKGYQDTRRQKHSNRISNETRISDEPGYQMSQVSKRKNDI